MRKVIWYVGQTAASGQDVIVTFKAVTKTGRSWWPAWQPRPIVMHGQPGWSPSGNSSPWVLWDAPAPARRNGLAIGLNMPGRQSAAGTPDNWIMMLAAPSVQAVSWVTPAGNGPRAAGRSPNTAWRSRTPAR